MNRKLGLEFSNPPSRGAKFRELKCRDAGLKVSVDPRLTAPGVKLQIQPDILPSSV